LGLDSDIVAKARRNALDAIESVEVYEINLLQPLRVQLDGPAMDRLYLRRGIPNGSSIDGSASMTMSDGAIISLRQVLCDAYLNPTGLVTEDGRVGAIEKLDSGQTVVVWR